LNNSFSIIVAAIEEGRRIIDNLRKIVVYLLSTSFSEIIVVGGALVVGLPMPLLPAQILWTNMLSEGFMNFAFAFEPKENDLMERNPKVSGARMMLSVPLVIFIMTIGLVSGLLLLGAHWFFINVEHLSDGAARTLIFTALTLSTTLIAFSLKDLRSSIWKTTLWSNGYLLASLAFALGGLYAALAFAPLSNLLRLVPVDFTQAIYPLLMVIIGNLAAVELAKYLLFPRRKK
jgi:Ca2+-transporting ATPase